MSNKFVPDYHQDSAEVRQGRRGGGIPLSCNLSPALVKQYQLQLPDKKLITAKLLALHEGLGNE